MPFDTHVSVDVEPDAESSSVLEPGSKPQPRPELKPVQNVEPVSVRRSNECVVL